MINYEYTFTYITILVLCALLISAMGLNMNRGVGRYQDIVVFRCMTIIAMISMLSEASWRIFALRGTVPHTVLWVANLMDLLATSSITYFWYLFIRGFLQHLRVFQERKPGIHRDTLPWLILLGMHISSYWTHFTFYIDPVKGYVRGELYLLHSLMTLAYLLVSIGLLIYATAVSDIMVRRKIVPMIVFTFCPILGGILQIIFGIAPFSIMSVALGITYLFISLQENRVTTDALTGLTNRSRMNHVLQDKIDNAREKPFILYLADIDSFKRINDTWGHIEGDKVLMRIADVFRQLGQEYHTLFVCRYGGDEFLFTLNLDGKISQRAFEEALRQKLREIQQEFATDYVVSMRMGWAMVYDKETSIGEVIGAADRMMYARKAEYYGRRS